MSKHGEYEVVLKDRDGYEICSDVVHGLVGAKARAKYFLTDAHAKQIGTSHDVMGSDKVEIISAVTGDCVWDAFHGRRAAA